MTTELSYLAWTLVLAFIQILLFDVARTRQYGLDWNMSARDASMPPLKPTSERLLRAQNNLYETLPLFIAAVLIAHVGGRESWLTAYGAAIYFWGRVVYVPLYAYGIPKIRSHVWLVSTGGLGMVFAAILIP